jgi:hypothetical protein
MFDFSKSFSSKSNLVRGLKAANIDIATCTVESKEGRWYASPIVTPVDNFEASESELAAQQTRPGHVYEEPVVAPPAPAPVVAPAPAAPVAKPVAATPKGKVKVVLEVRNEVTRPKDGGICAKAWAIFDRLGRDVQNKDAVFEGAKEGINEFTIRTQIYRWRTFNGIALQGRKKAK